MEKRWLFMGLLVFGILANLTVIGIIATEKKDTSLVNSWQPYSSKDAGFSLAYPAGWQLAETDRLRYDMDDEGIASAFVPLEKISTAKGYGPGGHPSPAQRDYSIAWEK